MVRFGAVAFVAMTITAGQGLAYCDRELLSRERNAAIEKLDALRATAGRVGHPFAQSARDFVSDCSSEIRKIDRLTSEDMLPYGSCNPQLYQPAANMCAALLSHATRFAQQY